MRTQRAPIFFPVTLVLIGVVILLNNFLLINADIVSLWPLLLILIGLQVIWRGDLAPGWEAHTFGITRGSVESATLEVNSAEIDVRVQSLQRAGRLIAGQYTARSRPKLTVRNNRASLVMRRGNTWLFSLADWELGLAQDVPWAILMSAHLGAFQVDLRGLLINQAAIATGFGDIRLITPDRECGSLYVNSTFGDIQLAVPRGIPAVVHVKASPLCRVMARGYQVDASGVYYATSGEKPLVTATVSATFGNIQLSIVD